MYLTISHWQNLNMIHIASITLELHQLRYKSPLVAFFGPKEVSWTQDSSISDILTHLQLRVKTTHFCENKNGHILPTGQWYAPSAVHSVILCYILLYSALHRFTLPYSAILCSICSTLLYSTLLYFTLLYSALHCSTLPYSALLCSICSTLLYSALFYFTLFYSVLLYYTLLYSVII